MAQITLSFVILVLVFPLGRAEYPTVRRRSRARAFIELQCQMTRYPELCINSLSPYISNFTTTQSPQQLAHVALRVSLARAVSTRVFVTEVAKQFEQTKDKDYRAIKDCLDQISNGVDQLTNCIKETENITQYGQSEFPWHASNVLTWISTAQTDANTCIDEFSGLAVGGKTKALIKARVLNLVQVTSNALALFNKFAARYRPSNATTKPQV